MTYLCECGREFTTPQGLGYHKRFCGKYKIFIDNDYEAKIGPDGKMVYIHREVMEQKLGRKLLPEEVVHHKDKNKRNNDPDNLELTNNYSHGKLHYDTSSEEQKQELISHLTHKFKKGNSGYPRYGEDCHASKLTTPEVLNIRDRLKNGEKGVDIAKLYNVDPSLISQIKNNVLWKHI